MTGRGTKDQSLVSDERPPAIGAAVGDRVWDCRTVAAVEKSNRAAWPGQGQRQRAATRAAAGLDHAAATLWSISSVDNRKRDSALGPADGFCDAGAGAATDDEERPTWLKTKPHQRTKHGGRLICQKGGLPELLVGPTRRPQRWLQRQDKAGGHDFVRGKARPRRPRRTPCGSAPSTGIAIATRQQSGDHHPAIAPVCGRFTGVDDATTHPAVGNSTQRHRGNFNEELGGAERRQRQRFGDQLGRKPKASQASCGSCRRRERRRCRSRWTCRRHTSG